MKIELHSKLRIDISLKVLTPETIKLPESTRNKITKDKNSENVPDLEVIEATLAHCNIVSNDYQQESRVLYTFVPLKLSGQLLEISPANFIF